MIEDDKSSWVFLAPPGADLDKSHHSHQGSWRHIKMDRSMITRGRDHRQRQIDPWCQIEQEIELANQV